MLTPRNIRDVQKIVGMHGIRWRFLAKMGEQSLPFYQLLKGNANLEWAAECQRAFDKLKEYLSQAPLLVSLIEGETLFIYLVMTEVVVSSLIYSLCNDKMLHV